MDSFEVLDRLSLKSIDVLKGINPNFESLEQIRVGIIVDKISQSDEKLSVIFKSLGFSSKSRQRVDLLEWLTAAYYEAMLINSDSVEVQHLFFALLLKIDTEKYYLAKKQYLAVFESKLYREANNYIEDFSEVAEKSKNIFIGREKELTKLIVNLSSDDSTPILLMGEAGSGKTSLMEEFARRVNSMRVPADLVGAKIYRVKFPLLMSLISPDQATFPSEYFSRLLLSMIEKDSTASRVILFIDDLKIGVNFFIGLGPGIKDKKISLVAASQNDLQEKFWESPLSRLWNIITLDDQPQSDYKEILSFHALEIENERGIKFSPNAVDKIVEMYRSGFMFESFPGYGIKLLSALATYKTHVSSNYNLVSKVVDELTSTAPKSKSKGYPAPLKDFIPSELVITEQDIQAYLGISDEVIEEKESALPLEKLLEMEETLKKHIIGQDEAIEHLARSLRVSSLKLHFDTRPLGCFLLLGPTGVGKTETAKAIAAYLFGHKDKHKKSPKNFLRIDMTEYSEKHAVSKLFGAPPGYIGYDESTSLSDFARENPHSLVLFDEIDKAHPEVLNSLLHIMDEAEIRTNSGEYVSFENVIILMTSNHGAELISRRDIGFDGQILDQHKAIAIVKNHEDIKDKLMGNLKRILKPEFLNRFDEIIVYHKLSEEAVLEISDAMLEPIAANLKNRGITLTVGSKVKKILASLANVEEYGARDLRRTIKREILDPIARKLLSDSKKKIKKIKISGIGKKIEVQFQ